MPTEPLGALPIDEKTREAWKKRLQASRGLRDQKKEDWKDYLSAYLGKPLKTLPSRDTVIVNKEFSFVEQKRAQLAFQVPEVQLRPKLPGLESATMLFQHAINHELSADGADAKVMLDEATGDCLLFGLGPTKIGYRAVTTDREVPTPAMDPMTGQPVLDPMTGQPAMTVETRTVLVHEEYFWRSIPPDRFLVPVEFEGEDFDQASWLAWEFEQDWELAKREYGLDDQSQAKRTEPTTADTLSQEKEALPEKQPAEVVKCTEIWYKSALFDPDAPEHQGHPQALRVLTFLDGVEEPVRHEPSPYQTWSPEGKLIGMMGFPLHVLTVRQVRGSAYPPGDVEMIRPLSEELSKGRTQMIQQRDLSLPMRWVDVTRINDPTTVHKLENGSFQSILLLQGNGNEAIGEVARAQFPRENFTFNEIVQNDLEEVTALGSPQRGLLDDSSKTATEVSVAQGAADVRLDAERHKVLRFFTTGARKFGALLQMFKSDEGYVQILGQEAQGLQAWDRTRIAGEFVFTAKPDSALRVDAAAERQQALNLYQLLANDPHVARPELVKSVLMRHNLDPSKIVVDTPPTKGPEPPKVSITINAEALAAPTPMLLEVLKQAGMEITPEMQQQAALAAYVRQVAGVTSPSPPHGGSAEQAEPLSKHQARNDGQDGRMGAM